MNTNIMNMTALRMWRRSSPASVLNPRAQMSLMSLNFKQIFKCCTILETSECQVQDRLMLMLMKIWSSPPLYFSYGWPWLRYGRLLIFKKKYVLK